QPASEGPNDRRLQSFHLSPDSERDRLQTGLPAPGERQQLDVPTLCRQPVHEQTAEYLGATAGVGRHEHIDSRWRIVQVAQEGTPRSVESIRGGWHHL